MPSQHHLVHSLLHTSELQDTKRRKQSGAFFLLIYRIHCREVGRDKYGEQVDIYSIGCILYLMLTGEDPPRNGGFPSAKLAKLDPDARDLIERLTHPNLQYRLELKGASR